MDAEHRTKRAAPEMTEDPMTQAVKALLDDLLPSGLEANGPHEQHPLQPAVNSIDDFLARRFPAGQ